MHSLNVIVTLDWIGNVLSYIPQSEEFKKLEIFAKEQIAIRMQQDDAVKDLFYYLTENKDGAEELPIITSRKEFVADIFLGILGGADTTASVLSNTFYSLLTTPASLHQLREEILSEFGDEDPADGTRLAKLPYLNAVIHEALRLYPPLPFNICRTPEPGSGGKIIAEEFVPEGTDVYLPAYVYHRDPRYFFPSPEEFRPERWITNDSSQLLNFDAFIPFSYGPANCVGKHLAYRKMRVVVARLVQKFEMEFEPGYNMADWLEELKDDSVFAKGRLPVKLKIRT